MDNTSVNDFTPLKARLKNVNELDLSSLDVIVHLGGVAHRMNETDDSIYFKGNYELTKILADRAKKSGVSHFIFVSTIKAFGEDLNQLLEETTECNPINDPYGESKLKAERYLESIEDENFKVAIVRPPLVYGPGAKGNLFSLMKLAETPLPLPLKKTNNRRTMVSVENLISLINKIIEKEASGLFLAGDLKPVSTSDLIRQIRLALGKSPSLISIPFFQSVLKLVKPGLEKRLFGSLEMDVQSTFQKLDFNPPYSFEQGIQSMVNWYLAHK